MDKKIWQRLPSHYGRSYLQPLAVAVVSVVFIGLILIMGLIDVQRIERFWVIL